MEKSFSEIASSLYYVWLFSSPAFCLFIAFIAFALFFLFVFYQGNKIENFLEGFSIKFQSYKICRFFGFCSIVFFLFALLYVEIFNPKDNPRRLLEICKNQISRTIQDRSLDKTSKKKMKQELEKFVNMQNVLELHILNLKEKEQNDKRLQKIRKEEAEQYLRELEKNKANIFLGYF